MTDVFQLIRQLFVKLSATISKWIHKWLEWLRIACHFNHHSRDSCNSYQQYEFLPSYLELMERPPSPTARVTAIAISIIVLLSFIWAYFGQLDIHATASGRLILPSRSQIIQSYELSEIVEIPVENGQHVQAGDKLLVLNIVGSDQDIQRYLEQKSFQQLELARYRSLLSDDPLKSLEIPNDIDESTATRTRALLASTWQEHQAILAKFDTELTTNQHEQIANQTSLDGLQQLQHNIQKRLIPCRKLASSNFVSKTELLTREKEELETKLSIDVKQKELKILQARADTILESRASYIAQKHREWHDNLNKAESALLIAQQELSKAQDRARLQVLHAPLDGIVQQLSVHTIGGIVQAAQVLMIITPHDTPQQAEIDITNKDIGFIKPGQSVTVKVEAFPYSRYGTIEGKILSVSLDSVKRNEQSNPELVFPAQIELAQNYILIGDESVVLTPGMTITAEIKIGRRRIIDYLLSPIREYKAEAWREP
ncbi:HlyD family type I secretion periplasmic adaptor subunit [Rickettsia hoogstraalii]|uniref:HlyD family type I secretion periplasmic adaptor subunit n=1 Tax=spotted fever group TaxID=114277 RepID=UPI0022526061|nr:MULTISPECIES: HlyD family type I secretion periplasmic adaptor subunit [spotted fever group]MCX4083998.1 HlyD family type I secretion periplasmic adaptor subunit [Rickettsia hoogstraalii]